MEKYCISCGMPLENPEDIGTQTKDGFICHFCINEDGTVKSCEEVFDGGVQFFMQSVPGVDQALAERVTRKNMNNQPLWKNAKNACLKGIEATDKEFNTVLAKLHTEIDLNKL